MWDVKGAPLEYKPQEKSLQLNLSIPLGIISAGDEVMLNLTKKLLFLLKRVKVVSTT